MKQKEFFYGTLEEHKKEICKNEYDCDKFPDGNF